MMDRATGRRGQPLRALAGVLLCWVALRVAVFDFPDPLAPREPRGVPAIGAAPSPVAINRAAPPLPAMAKEAAWAWDTRFQSSVWPARRAAKSGRAIARVAFNARGSQFAGAMPSVPIADARDYARPLAAAPDTMARPLPLRAARPGRARWSGDAWLVWREGIGFAASPAQGVPRYGGSQAGAVLRYALAPGSPHRPAIQVRAVQALARSGEGDLAAGLSARPIPAIPLTAHAEARMTRRGSDLTVRPVAFVSAGGETGPVVAGASVRGYVQAGYAWGRGATAFADGSANVERPVWETAGTRASVGAGAWGGAQRGATRLDVGPSASLRFRIGPGSARLSADYRWRMAGNASPGSGAALTLSAGF